MTNLVVGALLCACGAMAALKVNPVFTSNMVLQREKPISFFGTGDKGKTVKVTFAGEESESKVEDGSWQVTFPAMKVDHKNYEAVITDGKTTIKLTDLILGDVWLCGGQSNMEMPVGKTFKRGWSAENCEEEVKAADYPEIRYYKQVKRLSHLKPMPALAQDPRYKGWVKTTPANADGFSATAYFFGRELYQDLKIPIGLLSDNWSGSCIQPWISEEGYKAAADDLKTEIDTIEKFRLTPEQKKEYEAGEAKKYLEAMAAWYPNYTEKAAPAQAGADGWNGAEFDASAWSESSNVFENGRLYTRWYRTAFQLNDKQKGKDADLSVQAAGDVCTIWLNGAQVAAWELGKVGNHQLRVSLKADQLRQDGGNSLVVRSEFFYSGNARAQVSALLNNTTLIVGKDRQPIKGGWKMKDEFSVVAKELAKPVPAYYSIRYSTASFPSNMYNGMIDAWTRLPIKGVIWYQGCSNTGAPWHYYPLHKALIADWRAKWQTPDLPFILVQLAGYEPGRAKNWQTSDPTRPSNYAHLRDVQYKVATEVPNVGIATAIDIGEAANIHPANKQEVGRRLALEAKRIAYGQKVESRGPVLDFATPSGKEIRVKFLNAADGLKTSDGKAPGAFAVAGADKKFFWADSARIEGDTVVVSSKKVAEPKFVRYAYAGYRGDCNLYNQSNLPAFPFRSDAVDYLTVK
ncbi:MAG: beta galactosidase jelly roll domain-containing protein [Victivallales bacterium]|nr:beta galactosidase jelly roll domain-containing protein [Victivallales bacterium]